MRRSYGRRRPERLRRSRGPNAGRHPINYRSSRCGERYHLVRPFEAHHVDGVGSHRNEKDAHDVEVNGAPVQLKYYVRVSSEKHHEIELLRLVGETDDVLVGQDLEQQHQHCYQMQEISNQLEDVHIQL